MEVKAVGIDLKENQQFFPPPPPRLPNGSLQTRRCSAGCWAAFFR